jgi:hypothetical protein
MGSVKASRSSAAAIGIALWLLGFSPVAATAESQEVIEYELSCPRCSVRIDRVVSFGKGSDPYYIDRSQVPSRDSRGRYFVVGEGGSKVLMYDDRGVLIGAFGALGDGPGEFSGRGATFVVALRGDTLVVADQRNRLHTYAGNGARYLKTTAVAGLVRSGVALDSGNILINANMSLQSLSGIPFHELRTTGEFVRSFSYNKPQAILNGGNPPSSRFMLAGDLKSIWMPLTPPQGSRTLGAYQVNLDGSRESRVLVVNVPWLSREPRQRLDTVVNGRAMTVVIGSSSASLAGVDPNGYLWFNRMNLTGPYTPQMGVARAPQPVVLRLEVVDPRTKQVLASAPTERNMHFLPGSDLAYTVSGDGDGVPTYTIWRLSLIRG